MFPFATSKAPFTSLIYWVIMIVIEFKNWSCIHFAIVIVILFMTVAIAKNFK